MQADNDRRPRASSTPCSVPTAEPRSFLEGLIHGIRCGVLAVDADGAVILINDRARRILGVADIEPGAPIDLVLPHQPAIAGLLADACRMPILPDRAEIEFQAADGERKTIGFTLSLVEPIPGRVGGVAMFFKDLTRIEQHEEQERLKDRLAALGEMAASMAHEIRNPLASIGVSCQLLGRRLDGDTSCRGLLDAITAEIKRLERCVNSSLEFVRPVRVQLEPGSIESLLDEAVAVARERCPRPGVSIERSGDDLPPLSLDRALVRQVFINLLVNALEAVGDHGAVRITTALAEAPDVTTVPYTPTQPHDPLQDATHYAIVQIIDDGPGIAEDELGRIFQPFFTTKKNGSGVGLALARKIVGSHQGFIDAASSPGEGARFRLRLPVVSRPAEVPSS